MDQDSVQKKRITVRSERSQPSWFKAVNELPNPHPLQSWQWGEFKGRWGWAASPLLFQEEHTAASAQFVAASLVLKRKIPRLPFSILYVPRGPLLDYGDPTLREAVISLLEEHATKEQAIFIKIDPEVPINHGLDETELSNDGMKLTHLFKKRGWRFSDDQVQFRNTVELDLRQPEEALMAAMKQKTRYNIRLAGRKDIVVRLGNDEDFATIAKMYAETASRDQFTVRPEGYYLDIWKTFYDAGMAQPFLAEYQGQPIGAVIIVRYGRRAIYMYGASTDLERKRMPNHLLQWEAIRWAQSQGCDIYDFWGAPNDFVDSDPLWGVWRFKAGFSGQVVRHVGAWDYPARPFWYWLYTTAIPKYLAVLRSRKSS